MKANFMKRNKTLKLFRPKTIDVEQMDSLRFVIIQASQGIVHQVLCFFIKLQVLFAFVLCLVCLGSLTELTLYIRWWIYKIVKHSEVASPSSLDAGAKEDVDELSVHVKMGDQALVENQIQEAYPVIVYMDYLQYRAAELESSSIITILCAYSVPYNLWKLLTARSPTVIGSNGIEREHPLTCLDGIRVITMVWIIFGHMFLFYASSANNLLVVFEEMFKLPSFMILVSGTLSVDTFFFMSGLLSVYLTLNRYRVTYGSKELTKFWSLFTLHRFIRLSPAYLFVLIIYTGLINHIGDGPFYPQDLDWSDYRVCRRNWKRFLGLLFAALLIISGFAATIALVHIYQIGVPTLDVNWFSAMYVRPYARWGTYTIGMVLGWILIDYPHLSCKYRSRGSQIGLSIGSVALASLLTLLPLYGPYRVTSGELPPLTTLQSAFYHGLSRLSFVLGVAITVFLCATGCLEPIRRILAWSGFRTAARLTYCAYLTHPIVLMYLQLSAEAPVVVNNILLVSF
ncbi:unnamed protein product [Echinostoma caproni]|uniref:Acyl_transf_3 domain-containing protein n=1 Tax=Echinostoma caproni TaxID=27848 RepID=A0A183AC52_9TREM|nr:unnamed protein product [Echinostoma caproni]